MNVGHVGEEDDSTAPRAWGTTTPDLAEDSDAGVRREMSFTSDNKSVIEGDAE